MWLSGLATGVSGDIRIGFALPSLGAGVVTLALSVDLIRRLHGKRVAFIAGLWLIATLQFVLQARTAQIDMLVTAFIMLGCWGCCAMHCSMMVCATSILAVSRWDWASSPRESASCRS
ncbi:ArnT family glycosyltransferase [Cobetia marina]